MKQGAVLSAAVKGFHQLQIALADGVQTEKFLTVVVLDRPDVTGAVPQVFACVIQNGTGSPDGAEGIPQAEAIEGQHMELAFEQFLRVFHGEDPVIHRRPEDGLMVVGEGFFRGPLIVQGSWQQTLPRLQFLQFTFQRRDVVQFTGFELGCTDVQPRKPDLALAVHKEGTEEVADARFQKIGVQDRAGRDDPGDGAFDNAFRQFRVFHLLRDGDFHARIQQFGQVRFNGMVRDPAHGITRPFGQCDFQNGGSTVGIIEKHLVKVTETEQQNGPGRSFRLRLQILLHHGCYFVRVRHRCSIPTDFC